MKMPPTKKNQKLASKGSQSAEIREKDNNFGEKQGKQGGKEEICSACLFQVNIISPDLCYTECKHFYHKKCIDQWVQHQNTCCICRTELKKYQNQNITVQVPERPKLTAEQRAFEEFGQNIFISIFPEDMRQYIFQGLNIHQFNRLVGFDSAEFVRTIAYENSDWDENSEQQPAIVNNNQMLQEQNNVVDHSVSNQSERPKSRLGRRRKSNKIIEKTRKKKIVRKQGKLSKKVPSISRIKIRNSKNKNQQQFKKLRQRSKKT